MLLGTICGTANDQTRTCEGDVDAQRSHAGTRLGFPGGASASGAGEPGPRTLHRDCRLARRQNCARGESVAAFGLRLGGWLVEQRDLLFADSVNFRPHARSVSVGERWMGVAAVVALLQPD